MLLVLILIAGAYLRFTGQNWDDFTHLHPDERFLTGVVDRLGEGFDPTGGDSDRLLQLQACQERYPQTNGAATSIFDSQCSSWYPKNSGHGAYSYGELPLFIVKIAADLTAASSGDIEWTRYNGVHLVGRSVNAVADLLSVIFVFLIGRRLYNVWVGVLAATFYATCVFAIQLSHYWTTDAMTNLPVLIAFWFAVRAMDRARWYDFVGFGVGLGLAMATRINTALLGGVIVLAAIVYALPAFDMSLPGFERRRLFQRVFIGFFLAVGATIFTFRIANPHAFTGGPGILGFFNIIPYKPWVDELLKSQALATGNVDFPPNHQWASRTPYLFPWRNMVLWGMGVPLGLMAWFGWGWAAVQILRARPQWTRHILLVAWILVYFGYMGRQWVMTMRYYFNLYPFLILCAAWALWEIFSRSWAWMQRNPTAVRRLAAATGTLLLIGVVATTALWSVMFVRIYQRQLTRVEATRWVQRNLPAGFSTTLTAPDGRTRLINIQVNGTSDINVAQYKPAERQIYPIARLAGLVVNRVTINGLGDPERSGKPKHFSVALSTDERGIDIVSAGTIEADFGAKSDPLSSTYTVILNQPLMIAPGQPYWLVTWTDARLNQYRYSGDDPEFTLADNQGNTVGQVSLPVQNNEAISTIDTVPAQGRFTVPIDGKIDQIDIRHLLNPFQDGRKSSLTLKILDAEGKTLATGELNADANSTARSFFGDPFQVKLDKALDLKANQQLSLEVTSSAPVQVTGTVIAWEGDWDDPIPWNVCPIPPEMELTHDTPSGLNWRNCEAFGGLGVWYKDFKLQMALEDEPFKIGIMTEALNKADYIISSSNRFYDSLSRMPLRFPMSINFYNALFGGQLGFDLEKLVTSFPSIGNFEIADQYLPIYSAPKWLNEWESEEAFSVYDHPTVFIYKKNLDKYDPKVLDEVLNRVPLNEASRISDALVGKPDTLLVNRISSWNPLESSSAPTGFQLTPEQRAIQTQGGTWKDLFNREWPINTSPLLAVAGWWAVMLVLGLAAWPLLFVLLPALPDRAYPMAKVAGLLIVSWLVWAGGTLQFLTWTQAGIALAIAVMLVVSLVLVIRYKTEFLDYVRTNWRHLIIIELLTFILFVGFVFVRLGNPDLWAQTLGGEKPMDFAYFNAVLRSTIFPAYDPWYAGGYINYYYYGFVIVGTPVKLLGIMPSIAYNLIVPTLFALTGMGAFSVAFNVVAARWFYPRDEGSEHGSTMGARRRFALRVPVAGPYMAGVLALLLCVVLGNLDTPRVFFNGAVMAGGYDPDVNNFASWKLSEFMREHGRPPTPDEQIQLNIESENPSLSDQVQHTLYTLQRAATSLADGVTQLFTRGIVSISPERWFWAPTRIVSETVPQSSNEIHEMPYFTFVYADLHAHMIAMPLTLLTLLWLLAEILVPGHIQRPPWVTIGATALGGLVVGSLQPTNTWDWFTYLLLGMLGLTYAAFLRGGGLTRQNLLRWVGQLGWFYAVQTVAALPFTTYWATSYLGSGAVQSFKGSKTPLWAYFDIHGLFLFIIVSLLVWQTARLLRQLYVRDFIGRTWALLLVLLALVLTVLITLFLLLMPGQFLLFDLPIPLAIVCIPLLAWCAILFLLPDQSREMTFILALIGLALGVTFGVEVVVLGADIARQNTFFKFYMQAWVLFSVAGGVALAWLIQASERWRLVIRWPWLAFLTLLLAVSGLFPIMATQGKIAMRMASQAPHVLDGTAYMDYAIYHHGSIPIPLADDLRVIRWLQDNVQGSPAILEGHMSEYLLGNRISISTGLPSIIGWRFHQSQQRTIDPLPNFIWQRIANVNALYSTTDIDTAWDMLNYYEVEYIVVNKLEQTLYPAEGLAKFDQMVQRGLLELVYKGDYEGVLVQEGDKRTTGNIYNRIYRVVKGAAPNGSMALRP
jgi:YYY domain-containing protein